MKEVSFQSPLSLAIAEGATTPNPGFAGARVWSSTLSRPVTWDGSKWTAKSTAGGSANSVQYHNSGLIDGATNVAIHGGDIMMASNASPTTPPAGSVKLVNHPLASGGKPRAVLRTPGGHDLDLLSPNRHMRICEAFGGGASLTNPGLRGLNTIGTTGALLPSTASALDSQVATILTSDAVAGSVAAAYHASNVAMTSNGTGLGGFLLEYVFGPRTIPAGNVSRGFFGVRSGGAVPSNVSPATLLNCIGVGWDAGDTNYHIYYGGTAAQTPINLGANFPVTAGDLLRFALFSSPAESGVYEYHVTRMTATQRFEASGILGPLTTAQLLGGGVSLTMALWASNNTDAAAVQFAINKITLEMY